MPNQAPHRARRGNAVCALVLASFVTAPSMAQRTEPPTAAQPPPQGTDAPRPKAMAFRDLDVNADGKVSKDEAAIDAQLTREFAQVDRDGDGQLSETEYAAGHDRDHY